MPEVKEFGLEGLFKYERHTVDVDQSSTNIINVSVTRNPEFKSETTFLKVLIEGKATLYMFRKRGHTLYFYKKEGTQPIPLVHKIYRSVNSSSVIKDNNRYKQQLSNALKCDGFKPVLFDRLEYHHDKLIKLFSAYNNCSSYPSGDEEAVELMGNTGQQPTPKVEAAPNPSNTTYGIKTKRNYFDLSLRPRISRTRFVAYGDASSRFIDFGGKNKIRPGIELAYNFLGDQGNLSIFVEGLYNVYESTGANNTNNGLIKYRAIELPYGMRYSFNRPQNSGKFYMSLAFVSIIPLDWLVELNNVGVLPTTARGNFAFSLGYKDPSGFSVELRRLFNRKVIADGLPWSSTYKGLSFIVGYTIL